MAQIIPIRDLRKTTEISELCNSSNEPVFVTKNGYGDLVVMSMKAYEERFARADIVSKVQAAMQEVEDGALLLDGKETLVKLRAKHVK
ncbi:MAG: type II toxin-antitoxin system Phd/YefM family antitoxin [Christensenellaceae bacterium]|jgi:PHD/YefM family antitoxin component YafN of YafNO toxin-antitoxin module|nr:type II toxin-antitoxin system Phd/YefM family antitoxin [Christensenellaceae bacterium]